MSLVHPPYVVAIGCMAIAAALTDRNVQPWLEGLACDLNEARACLSRVHAEESLLSASRRTLGTTGRCATTLQLYLSLGASEYSCSDVQGNIKLPNLSLCVGRCVKFTW